MPNNPFVNLFGRSPVGPIQRHMTKAHECTTQLVPFIDALMAEDWVEAERIQQRISSLEREADQMKKDIRVNLPNSLFLSVPRSDLLELLSVQDKVANRAKDIAGLMLGRKMKIHPDVQPAFRRFVERSVEAATQALRAMDELSELMETSFAGREVKLVEKLIDELEHIEHDTDEMQIKLRAELYKREAVLPPVDVMFTYQIIEWIGDVADRAERVGNRLGILMAR
ncbi:TIGR00153 family protein [Pseudomonas sp. MYb185]|uniref:TIGR00153 family protein n=1 Tax=Pseudomonas sp. MYb185 TaxID=1848729 RepID=UPI000CFBEA01|nr:TIGR00153 family protein [Pseudomonas sp. MYb185]PRB84290.1 TIGR00153 family protein [Pseudomonas sp. MYb185]